MNGKYSEVQALKQEIMESLHCALPGEIVSYDSQEQTADIQPTIKTRSGKALPLLRGVPVHMPISFNISEGDICLVVFADADIDGWIAAGEASEAASDRKHSLSDGFAFVGFMNNGGQPGGGGDDLGFYIDDEGYVCQEIEEDLE